MREETVLQKLFLSRAEDLFFSNYLCILGVVESTRFNDKTATIGINYSVIIIQHTVGLIARTFQVHIFF